MFRSLFCVVCFRCSGNTCVHALPAQVFVTHSGFLCSRQVARAGRFGTKGLAITFVSDETDAKTLNDVQDRFEVNVAELPDEIDISSYSKSSPFSHIC